MYCAPNILVGQRVKTGFVVFRSGERSNFLFSDRVFSLIIIDFCPQKKLVFKYLFLNGMHIDSGNKKIYEIIFFTNADQGGMISNINHIFGIYVEKNIISLFRLPDQEP